MLRVACLWGLSCVLFDRVVSLQFILFLVVVVTVAFPFLLSWFATSPFTGVYSKNDDGVLQTTLKGWIVAIPLGCVFRGVIKGYVPPLPFVIVTMIATLVVLGGTRFVYSKVAGGTDE